MSDHQFGFRAGHSTTQQLVRLLGPVRKGVGRERHTVLLSLDMEAAFDQVPHDELFFKLRGRAILSGYSSCYSRTTPAVCPRSGLKALSLAHSWYCGARPRVLFTPRACTVCMSPTRPSRTRKRHTSTLTTPCMCRPLSAWPAVLPTCRRSPAEVHSTYLQAR